MSPMRVPPSLRPGHRRSASATLILLLAAVPWCAADATPRWWISRPQAPGGSAAQAPAPLQKEAARDKELAERYPIHLESVEVEGIRERDGPRITPRTAEQRFADALNVGSPELVAGKSYNGYYYDGTLFWASDPLSFAWKNVTHWLKR